MKKNPKTSPARRVTDVEFGYDLTPDIINGVNTMQHKSRSDAVQQQIHAAPRNNTKVK